MTLASVRPDDWNFPLLLHVLGAMVFVGVLATVTLLLVVSLRSEDRRAVLRLAFRTLLIGAIPSYIVLRGSADWVAEEEDLPEDLAWIDIGYMVTDVGLLLLIAATVMAGLSARRGGGRLVRPTAALTIILIAASGIALWAMTAKPT
jgi:hypothetical protein